MSNFIEAATLKRYSKDEMLETLFNRLNTKRHSMYSEEEIMLIEQSLTRMKKDKYLKKGREYFTREEFTSYDKGKLEVVIDTILNTENDTVKTIEKKDAIKRVVGTFLTDEVIENITEYSKYSKYKRKLNKFYKTKVKVKTLRG